MQERISLGPLTLSDLPEVVRLEAEIFGDNWSEAVVRNSISDGIRCGEAHLSGTPILGYDYGTLAARKDGKLLGYLFCAGLLGEGELHRIAVDKKYRKMGLGSLLMEGFTEWLKERDIQAATLEVRAGNIPAIRLYEKYGFVSEGLRKNYYHHPEEDGRIMWKRSSSEF